jgi:hypothetical protein
MENSVCLLLATSLHTAVDLDSIINPDEFNDSGLIKDHHITIVYDESNSMDKGSILDDVRVSLGSEFDVFNTFMEDSYKFRVNDIMYLDTFNNDDSSYLVLKLKDNNELFNKLNTIHEYLMSKYNIKSDFSKYSPHVTLAELLPNEADKYLSNKTLNKVLNDSKIGFEDLVFSEEIDGKYIKWNLTTHHALDRYFRETKID